MKSRKVVVSQRLFDDEAIEYLKKNNCDVVMAELPPGEADGGFSHDHLVQILDGADAWIVGHARVTSDLLKALPNLQVISRRGVGYDNIDVKAATALRRVATIASGGNEISVADHTIGLMLAVSRRFREAQQSMAHGSWKVLQGGDLSGKKVGIIGFGRIGRQVAKRLTGFDVETLVLNRGQTVKANHAGVRFVDFEELVCESDFITLHAPLNEQTRCLIDKSVIERMKPSAILINAGRGGLVEDAHLLAALKTGQLGGAGLDVFMSELDESYKHVTDELVGLGNVVCTPHAAASSKEGLILTNRIAARNAILVLDGESPPTACIIADGRLAKGDL